MGFVPEDFKQPQTAFEKWTFVKGLRAHQPIQVARYTEATLPSAADWEAGVIYVTDGAAGTRFRGSDGTSWVTLG